MVMHMMSSWRPLFIWLVWLPAVSIAKTNIIVKADRHPVLLEESFDLIFEADGAVDDEPDFTPLTQDFDILSTHTGSSISVINARISTTKTWTLTLFARREGRLPIPAIAFGADRSPATAITVQRTSPGQGNRPPEDIFLILKVRPQEVYVQQQLIAKVKLYRAVNTANATLSEPELTSGKAIIEPLDKDSEYETIINNQRYQVLERSYAVYPQESGTMQFKPIRFQGQIARQSGFMFNPFGPRPRTVVRQSPVVELTVKAIADAFTGTHWLPASRLTLSEQWSQDPLTMRVNAPITRTLNITAEGLTASQLPVLTAHLGDAFKQYPDQPVLETRKTLNGSTGIRQEKSALIPTAAGDFTLPEVRLPWWNTQTDTLEYAVLPERTVRVLADATAARITPPPVAPPAVTADALNLAEDSADDDKDPAVKDVARPAMLWNWLTIVLAAGWLLTLSVLAVFLFRQRRPHTLTRQDDENHRMILAWLKQACHEHDAGQAKSALLAWGRLNWGQQTITSLGDIQQRCQPGLAAALADLSQSLYGRQPTAWRGESLWSAFQQAQTPANTTAAPPEGELQPLNRL